MSDTIVHPARRHARRVWCATRPFVNTTLLFAIILVVAMLWLVSATQSFVDSTLAEIRFGLLQEIDDDAKQLIAELRAGVSEFDRLRSDIARIADHPSELIDPEIRNGLKSVEQDANRIAQSLERIASGHTDLSQETLEKLAVSIVRACGGMLFVDCFVVADGRTVRQEVWCDFVYSGSTPEGHFNEPHRPVQHKTGRRSPRL